MFEQQLAIRGVRHIMPDLPGFGQSRARVGDMTIDDYARVVIDVLDQRGLDRAIFAGLSMGGYICLAVARLAPQRLQGLILLDTRETPDSADARKGRYESIEKVKKDGVQPIADAMLPKMLTSGAPQELKDRVREIMTSSSAEGVIAALKAMAERPDSSDVLAKIDVPTLIVVGDDDAITPPSDAERMAKAIRGARVVRIGDAAHLANVEKPEEVNRAIAAFASKFR